MPEESMAHERFPAGAFYSWHAALEDRVVADRTNMSPDLP